MNILIHDVKAYSFGVNNYSNGMNPVTFNPKDISWEKVAQMDGVFLNPFAQPNTLEIFALVGTQEQFDGWFEQALSSYGYKRAIANLGMPSNFRDEEAFEKIGNLAKQYSEEFTAWYDNDPICL
jgi:hypothetical protein